MSYLEIVLLISLLSAFVITLAKKWGYVEKMQVHGCDLLHKLASCNFCLSWWTNVIFSLIAAIIMQEWQLLFAALFGTMITRFLL